MTLERGTLTTGKEWPIREGERVSPNGVSGIYGIKLSKHLKIKNVSPTPLRKDDKVQ
jgi:hypothetical protein